MTDPPERPLAHRYDGLLLDLDGVVYRGDQAVPGAAEALERVRRDGIRLQFLTNNSARTPQQVAEKLTGLGVDARPDEVLTSSVATAAMLRREGWADRSVFVIGEIGAKEALTEAGLRVLPDGADRADLVVVGWDRSLDYDKLRTAALLVRRGARLVATNADATYPAPDGLWPGAGSILAAVVTATAADPVVVGKPARPMFEAAAERIGSSSPLVVGDRLDTDIAGAVEMGWDSLLVTTGAHGLGDLIGAPALPTYVGDGLGALARPAATVRFRAAATVDMDAIAALLEASRLVAQGAEDRISHTVVGEDDGDGLAATAVAEPLEGELLVRSVAVREDLRGQGVGSLVVAAAVRTAWEPGTSKRIWAFTETASAFFARLGFEPIDRAALPSPVARSRQLQQECATSATVMVRAG